MDIRELVGKIVDSDFCYPDATFSTPCSVNTCINPYSYHLARLHRQLYGDMDGIYVDGIFMCLLIKLLWGKPVRRLSFDMSGMAADLFKMLNSDNCHESIYLIGAKQDQIENTIKQILKSFPGMEIAGYRNGYFIDADDRRKAIKTIINSNARFTIVGMGSPLQEQFALDLKNAGYRGTVFTCGGFLHQSAARMNYYPDWVNRWNLRAFYRLFHEKGMFSRLYNVLIEFPILFAWDTLYTRLGSTRS